MKFKSAIVTLSILFIAATVHAEKTNCATQTCLYINPGSSGDGKSWDAALGSIPTTLNRGTTYFLADGNYSGRNFNTPSNGQTITLKKATSADHGTDTGWQASFGDGQVAFTSGLEFTTSDWVLDGQIGGGAENAWAGNFGIKITEVRDGSAVIRIGYDTTANNITIRHVEMQGKGSVSTQGGSYSNDGLAIYGDSNITLSHFRMRGIGRGPFFVSPKNLIVEHGWVEKYYGSSAVHSEVASIWGFAGSVGDVTFRHNLFTDIQSTGGLMWDNSSNTAAKLFVYGNVFYRPPGATWARANGLVGGWTGGGGEQFHNAKVYNNTFINVDQESLSTLPRIASGNEAYNNIFYNSDSPNFAKFSAHDHNYFVNSGGTQGEPNGRSLNSTSSLFVNMAVFDFRLSMATPAGRVLPAPFNLDPLNRMRGSDDLFDRGAMEFAGTASPAVKLTSPKNLRVITGP